MFSLWSASVFYLLDYTQCTPVQWHYTTISSYLLAFLCLFHKDDDVSGHFSVFRDRTLVWDWLIVNQCRSTQTDLLSSQILCYQTVEAVNCFKVKLSPKCNLGFFFCKCIWVKPSCKSIITTKEALTRLTVFSFSGQVHFQWEGMGHFYASIKIAIFKTLRTTYTLLFLEFL